MSEERQLIWRRGAPQSPGWYPASVQCNPNVMRWWNGERWSQQVDISSSQERAARLATQPADEPNELILWSTGDESAAIVTPTNNSGGATGSKRSGMKQHHVLVEGVEYRSVKAAFEALHLPLNKHEKFRAGLKKAGTATFEGRTFTIKEA